MAEGYQLVLGYSGVRRLSDGALVPVERGNADWQEYLEWWRAGGVPEPAPEGWFEYPPADPAS